MKQKLVLQVDMFDDKRRSKAMKTAVGAEGVSSVALDGKEKRKLVVIGEHMDAFELVKSLRKKNFRVDMESLEEVKSEKKEEKAEEKKAVEQWPCVYQAVPPAAYYDSHNQHHPNCPIM